MTRKRTESIFSQLRGGQGWGGMIEILFISILERPVAFAVRHAYAAKRHGGLSGRPGSRSVPKGHLGHLPGNRKIGAVPRSGQRRALANTRSPVPEDHFSNASKNSPQLSPPLQSDFAMCHEPPRDGLVPIVLLYALLTSNFPAHFLKSFYNLSRSQ